MVTEENKKEQTAEAGEKKKKPRKSLKNLKNAGQGFFKDFKTFMSKGNVIQLAVAFIMGAAFTTIVNSLVADIFMPFFNLIFGGSDISDLRWVISDNLIINYGNFIFAVLNFLLISFVLFLIIKAITKAGSGMKKLKKGVPPPPPPPPAPLTITEQLLTEIKELLLKQEKDKTKEKAEK